MLFRLAARSGRTVRELSDALGADELAEWHEYYDLEPFGCESQQLAMLCSLFANAYRPRYAAAVSPEMFLPTYDPDKPQDVGHIKAVFFQAFAVARQNEAAAAVTHEPQRKLRDTPGLHLGSKLDDA